MRAPRSVLITGASSGIGLALAESYAAPGVALWLGGRDAARLDAVVSSCRARGAAAEGRLVDVTDREAMAAWIVACDEAAPLDLVIANAGISSGAAGEAALRAVFACNVDGVVNTVLPALERMRPRRAGQLALMSSLAGFRGMPGAPAYAASKAAVRSWGEGLRGALMGDGIAVSVICPGFVESRITAANRFPMPFLMDAPKAAALIRRGLERDRGRIAFPFLPYAMAWLLGALPPGWTDRLLARMPRKG
ncbi:MAG: SDR family NAD(P)-dependent oxidoreductase [Alphaproteobacteria bacterium]|nr:SDR family NAD(P)-dependent oxidoreductase [Alphaproteobacteria bacterium]